MTLKRRQEIVRTMMQPDSAFDDCVIYVWNHSDPKVRDLHECRRTAASVLRDYLNGRFTLDPKKRKGGGR